MKRKVKVDLDELAIALDTDFSELHQYLDLETGRIVMILDPLVSPQRLHRLRLTSSAPIRGSLSSGLTPRTAQRSSFLTFSRSQSIRA